MMLDGDNAYRIIKSQVLEILNYAIKLAYFGRLKENSIFRI